MIIVKGQRKKLLCAVAILAALWGVSGCKDTAGSSASGTKNQETMTEAENSASAQNDVLTEVSDETGAGEQKDGQSESNVDLSKLYVITKLDTEDQLIEFEDLKFGKSVQYAYTGGTYFYDKYGQSVSVGTMCCGKIVIFEETGTDGKLKSVSVSDQVWEYDDITDFSIDEEEQIITLAGTKYYYGSKYWVFSNEEAVALKDITEADTLAVEGVDRKILSVMVTNGHGTLKLTNTELFEGGWLKIGKIYKQVEAGMELEVPEGTYNLSVANDGWGDSKEVTVVRGEMQEIDLNNWKGEGPKYCTINFTVSVQGAVLTLNGDTIDYSQPVSVRYGTYVIAVSADGYDTISKYLIVSSETADIDITMTSNGSGDDSEAESTSDDSSDTTGNTSATNGTTTGTTTAGGLAGSMAGSMTGGSSSGSSGSGTGSSAGTGTSSTTSGSGTNGSGTNGSTNNGTSSNTGASSTTSNGSTGSSDVTDSTLSTLLDLLTDGDD